MTFHVRSNRVEKSFTGYTHPYFSMLGKNKSRSWTLSQSDAKAFCTSQFFVRIGIPDNWHSSESKSSINGEPINPFFTS